MTERELNQLAHRLAPAIAWMLLKDQQKLLAASYCCSICGNPTDHPCKTLDDALMDDGAVCGFFELEVCENRGWKLEKEAR